MGRAAPAALAFLRGTKVGGVVNLAPPEEEEGGEMDVIEFFPQEEVEEQE